MMACTRIGVDEPPQRAIPESEPVHDIPVGESLAVQTRVDEIAHEWQLALGEDSPGSQGDRPGRVDRTRVERLSDRACDLLSRIDLQRMTAAQLSQLFPLLAWCDAKAMELYAILDDRQSVGDVGGFMAALDRMSLMTWISRRHVIEPSVACVDVLAAWRHAGAVAAFRGDATVPSMTALFDWSRMLIDCDRAEMLVSIRSIAESFSGTESRDALCRLAELVMLAKDLTSAHCDTYEQIRRLAQVRLERGLGGLESSQWCGRRWPLDLVRGKSLRRELVGRPAPDCPMRIRGLDGSSGVVTLRDFAGKVVVVSFVADKCSACPAGMRSLRASLATVRKPDVTMLSVVPRDAEWDAGGDGHVARVDDLAQRYGIDWPIAIVMDAQLFADFGVCGVPMVVVIDRKGAVVGEPISPFDGATLLAMINEADAGESRESVAPRQ
ncbi:MAG: TlpA disulfide reductase family protein [Phycisphaerales bacterium]